MPTLVTLEEQPASPAPLIGALSSAPKVAMAPIVVTRPNNATQYAIGDVYGDAADARIQIPNVNRLAGGIASIQAILAMNSAQATKPSFDFWFFDGQPATVIGDNAPFSALSDADVAKIIGRTAFVGSSSFTAVQPQAGKLVTPALFQLFSQLVISGRDVWMYIVLANTYTPVANETLTLRPLAQYFT